MAELIILIGPQKTLHLRSLIKRTRHRFIIVPNFNPPPIGDDSGQECIEHFRALDHVSVLITTDNAKFIDCAVPEEIWLCKGSSANALTGHPHYQSFQQAYAVGIQYLSEVLIAQGFWT